MSHWTGRTLAWLGGGGVAVSHREQARAACAAALGLLLTMLAIAFTWGLQADLPLLAPPIAATTVLVFAAPASPLAQPWNAIAGNVLSALVGVACAVLIPSPMAAVALAPALAILVMFLARCLHPPGGAVALTAVLGGPAIKALGFGFALYPVALQTVLLVGVGIVLNRATGRRYPHVPAQVQAAPGPVSSEDVRTVLRRHDEVVDVAPDDLVDLIREVEEEAALHGPDAVPCGAVMQRRVPSCGPDASVQEALGRMVREGLAFLAVLDGKGRFLGAVTPLDLAARPSVRAGGMGRFRPQRVGDRIDPSWPAVTAATSLERAADLMVRSGRAWIAVLGEDRAFEGTLSHAAVIAHLAGGGMRGEGGRAATA